MINQNLFNAGIEGFLASLVLIVAIGSQNVYVLKCSIKNYFPYQVGFACFFGDIILMNMGVFGLAEILSKHLMALNMIRWFGVAFVMTYGCFAIYNLYDMQNKIAGFKDEINNPVDKKSNKTSAWKAILVALSFTFLNPHVYLDTVLIIGNLGVSYPPDQRIYFIIGCLTASALWFFTLSSAGKLFARVLSSIRAWQLIELSVACIMFFIAYQLIQTNT